MKTVVFAVVLLISAKLPAQTAEHDWMLAAVSTANDSFYVDNATLTGAKTPRSAWVEIRLAVPDTTGEGKRFTRSVLYASFLCGEPKFSLTGMFRYSEHTLIDSQDDPSAKYSMYPPGSTWERVAHYVCSRRR